MKTLRSILAAATSLAGVILLAACGDKVNILPPATKTPQVLSVTVAPATAAMTIGQTITLVVSVNAEAGATYTVAWTTSDASKVSVNATTGAITSIAVTPGVAVCAAAGGKQGCASIIVASTATPVPAAVSIAAVNFTNGAGVQQPAPVPPGAIGTAVGIGQVNVVMNLNIGTNTPDSIVLRISGQTAYKQAFTAAQAAALRASASVDELGQVNGQLTITASVNVMDYCSPALPPLGVGPAGTCPSQTNPPGANLLLGAARWQNGNQSFQAFFYGKATPVAGGSPVNSQSSSPVATYRFANLDGWHLNMSITPVTELPNPAGSPTALQNATATDLAGFSWKGGTMGVTAWFVQYTVGVEPISTPGLVNVIYNQVLPGPAVSCSANGIKLAPLTKVQAANAALTAGPWTATLAGPTAQGAGVLSPGSTIAATNLVGYEFDVTRGGGLCGGVIFTSGGEMPSITAVGTDNNNILTFPVGFNGGGGIINTFANSNNSDQGIVARIDNVAPPGPVFSEEAGGSTAAGCSLQVGSALVSTFNGRTNCWFNDAVVLNGLSTGFNTGSVAATSTVAGTTANGIIFAGIDVGSGRQVGGAILTTFAARADLATVATATVDGNAAITSTAGLAEGGVNNLYQLRIRSTDPINNTRNSAAGTFGVDRTPPTLTQIGGPANGARATVAGGSYVLSASDPLGTGSSGPALGSGFFSTSLTPVTLSQSQRNVAGTLFWCPSAALGAGAYQSSSTACPNTLVLPFNNGWITGTSYLSNFNFSDTHGSLVDAYYAATSTITDQAGNVGPSPALPIVELVDATPPSISGLTWSPAVFPAGGTANFSPTVADNLDVQLARLNVVFVGLSPILIDQATGVAWAGFTTAFGSSAFWYPDLIVNPYNATPLIPNLTISYPIAPMMTNVRATTNAAGANPGAVGTPLAFIFGFDLNQANSIGFTNVVIPAGNLPPATAISNTGLAGAGPTNWVMTNTAGTTNLSRTGAGGLATSILLTAQAVGATGVFNNPWAAVQFWAYDPTPLNEGWHLIATQQSVSSTTDTGVNRIWGFSTLWTPTTANAPTAAACPGGTTYRVLATGVGGQNLPAAQQGMVLATPVSQRVVTVCP